MKAVFFKSIVFLLFLEAFLNDAYGSTQTRVFKQVWTTPVIYFTKIFQTPGPHTIETANLVSLGVGQTPDTYMFVWDLDTKQEIAQNDDIAPGNYASKVIITNYSGTRRVFVVIVAYNEGRMGYADVKINGTTEIVQSFFGGRWLRANLQGAVEHEFYAVSQAGNVSPSQLFSFGCDGKLKAYDTQQSGVGTGSYITPQVDICSLIVATDDEVDNIAVYANDHLNDIDGDGLGGLLELEIGTCDYHTGVIAAKPYCSTVIDARDTDHDGLSDDDEILGREDSTNPQLLPAWGANPLHKDLFIEIDYLEDTQTSNSPLNPFDGSLEQRVFEVQQHFSRANSSWSLKNPDGQDGINIHLDIGTDPPSNRPDLLSLYGAWGGSQVIAKSEMSVYNPNKNENDLWRDYPCLSAVSSQTTIDLGNGMVLTGLGKMNDVRNGIFLYALQKKLNGPRGSFVANLEFNCVILGENVQPILFSHEFGHHLGLDHWGQDHWGIWKNNKPNYPSIMNYGFTGTNLINQFSLENSEFINPPQIKEKDGVKINKNVFNVGLLQGTPFALNFFSGFVLDPFEPVDWNFNGINDQSVEIRAPLFLHQYGGLLFFPQSNNKQNILLTENMKTSVPKILRINQRLYTFYSGNDGQLKQRHGIIQTVSGGSGQFGSCEIGQDSTLSTGCVNWTAEASIQDQSGNPTEQVLALTAVWNDVWQETSKVTFAYQQGSSLYVRSAQIKVGTQNVEWIPSEPAQLLDSQAHNISMSSIVQAAGIELSWVRVNPDLFGGKNIVLSIFYLDSNRRLKWQTKNSTSAPWINQGFVLFGDQNGSIFANTLQSAFSPAVVNIPHIKNDGMRTCGIFSRDRNLYGDYVGLEIWCLNPEYSLLRWIPPTLSGLGKVEIGNTSQKPSVFFHTPRTRYGYELENGKGYFVVSVTKKDYYWAADNDRPADVIEVFLSRPITASTLFTHTPSNKLFSSAPRTYYYAPDLHQRNMVFYEDTELAATKAVILEQNVDKGVLDSASLRFVPLADGTYSIETHNPKGGPNIVGIKGGDDFSVMAETLCKAVLRTSGWPCKPCDQNSHCPSGSCSSGICTLP